MKSDKNQCPYRIQTKILISLLIFAICLFFSGSQASSSSTFVKEFVNGTLSEDAKGQTNDTCTFEHLIRNKEEHLNTGDSCYFKNHSPMDFLNDLRIHPKQAVMVLDVPDSWISLEDANLLIQIIDSDEPAAPVISLLSSFWPVNQTSTVGNEALFLLNGYRTGLYPPSLCSLNDNGYNKTEMRSWWNTYGMAGLPDEQDAIRIVKRLNPELNDYPSDQFPEKTIRVEKDPGGWYVSFIQEGSGVPIISAQCYYVGIDGVARPTGSLNETCMVQTKDFSAQMCGCSGL